VTFRLTCFLAALLLLAPLLPATVAGAPAVPATLSGTVTWVYDADTLEVAPHGRVRLLGIDSPEKTASDRDQSFTTLGIAKARLRPAHGAGIAYGISNVKGKSVALIPGATPRDRHGRLLAYVRLPDGRLLNRLLLEEGLVIVYRRFAFEHKGDFLAAEADAKRRGVGLWSR
jgi:micrococcal nuclease